MAVLYIILAALAVLVLVVLARTLAFKPGEQKEEKPEQPDYDARAAVDALGQLVRCKTVSFYDRSLEDEGEFQKLIALLPELYPNVSKTCSLTKLRGCSTAGRAGSRGLPPCSWPTTTLCRWMRPTGKNPLLRP